MNRTWEFWIDRGGTFTDVVGAAPDGSLVARKVPSRAADGGPDPGVAAALAILAARGAAADGVAAFKVGTTVATNALLERRGSRVLFVTTRGFGDALVIGRQERPDIFALRIERTAPLYERVLEVDERIDADGRVLAAPDEVAVRADLVAARAAGCDAVAIALLHAWAEPRHERAIAALARAAGFAQVATGHELVPLPRYLPRAQAAAFEAYLEAALQAFTARFAADVARVAPAARSWFMQSSGGLTSAAHFRAMASVLSGPAGGLMGMARLGETFAARLDPDAAHARLVGFDMGGTSTDVSVFDGAFPRRFEHEVAGQRLTTPMLDVHTIAAGGGSQLALEGGRCVVGPRSAGADPGPACYGRGGPPTLTDAQVVLGRLDRRCLPRVFGPGGDAPIDPVAAQRALAALRPDTAGGDPRADEAVAVLAEGFLDVAVAAMANAIRHVTSREGHDPAAFTLFAFGGAAGQHACRVAAAAGIARVLVHPLASVLSAWGIGTADWIEVRRRGIARELDVAGWADAAATLESLGREAADRLRAQAPGGEPARVERVLELRDEESEATLDIVADSLEAARAAFHAAHERRYGYRREEARIVVAAVRAEAGVRSAPRVTAAIDAGRLEALPASTRVRIDGQWRDVPVRSAAGIAAPLDGPALIVEPHSTFVLEPGWRIEQLGGGALLARATGTPGGTAPARRARADADADGEAGRADPARLAIFNGLFMHVAGQMGELLTRTAQSVNIKERLDFSCAVFDGEGGLVANAPHMPVHLGSMGATVAAVLRRHRGAIRRGDAWLVNSPWHGGTHLPDMTVVSPVFIGAGTAPRFFVASRAHHADIGGISPGSMPAFSTRIDQEGACFEDFALLEGGRLRRRELEAALRGGRWPARNVPQNLADLAAQLAANARGAEELQRCAAQHGTDGLARWMRLVQDNAADCVAAAIARLGDREGHARLQIDTGPVVEARIRIDAAARRAAVDFTGTSAAGAHNFNAPRAVCEAAVLYVFRTLVDASIPLNEGCRRPITISIPPGSLLDPPPGAAVVAGNVETSQVVVDALYLALGVLAGSQGTMNNLTFGDDALQYYETIAGGAGAGHGFDGCDAVQTHMTNSRLTDPEVLERRFPVLLREFAIRRSSGGKGRWRGGDGAVRRIEFRARLRGSLLSNRRLAGAPGLDGGAPGAPGCASLRRADGTLESLAACASFDVGPGDTLEVRTPGGGGFGS
jgi:5-oxoprolinase (ATP-hydrolysing)